MLKQRLTQLSTDQDLTQYPYATLPPTPEASEPRYVPAPMESMRIRMRDGVHLEADIFRPAAAGQRFPALVACSPYGKFMQHTPICHQGNEAGDIDFWVRRGYAQVIFDVRGAGGSEGLLCFLGDAEQQDGADLIEWVAQQPWCNGKVGMIGMSYYAMIQYLVAAQQPPSLKAIFPYDGANDLYREWMNTGGLNVLGFDAAMTYFITRANLTPGIPQERAEALLEFGRLTMNRVHREDGPYFWERSACCKMDRIKVPVYCGSGWYSIGLHLRGAFTAWENLQVPKRLLITGKKVPARPWRSFHVEALRWYDHYLKGMDTGVHAGPPVNLYTLGAEEWRSHQDWPLPTTRWTEWHLSSDRHGRGVLLDSQATRTSTHSFTTDPESPECLEGLPALVYRTEPFERDTEITGPVALYLVGSADQPETFWIAKVLDEDAAGQTRVLTKGWLRGTHRALDRERSRPWRPFHPHRQGEPLVPGEPTEFPIEIWPTSNVFKAGHRFRLEVSACDSPAYDLPFAHYPYSRVVTNTVHEGGARGSKLLVPLIPS
ncbi:MAG: CocE/NonD family hydrolase [Candidatus Tectomicrobia bacterium]|nr:CocE/NonD family hydrolase [Candidatus Tectomicrobia bacterium]